MRRSGLSEGAAPTTFRFGAPTEAGTVVEVGAGPDCGYRSAVDEVTLSMDPVHSRCGSTAAGP